MKVLLIGRWGKTHALAKELAGSKNVELYSLMDKKNTGIDELSVHSEIGDIKDIHTIEKFVERHRIGMIVVVPEMVLAEDITTFFRKKGIPAIGPSKLCTKLEGDKGFLRDLMKENNIDASPDYNIFFNKNKAIVFIRNYDRPVAVKPAGITEGDGVKVMGIQLQDKNEAVDYVKEIFNKSIGGLPHVIIEEKIEGEEYTIQMICDGKSIIPLPAVKDYKLLEEGDSGLNTPGMGSCSYPDHLLPFLSRETFEESVKIVERILDALKERYNEKFKGILSGQYMLTKDSIKLVEINVRPGDSEILNITPILKTDFLEICKAIDEEKLDEIEIVCENKATVCKYIVPEGFPTPEGNCKLMIDKEKIDRIGTHLFQSCFEIDEFVFEPSPRLFAVTGVGDTLNEAYEKCEEGLSCITGDNLFYRKDIGSPELSESYRESDLLPD
ncbi:MAG: phosphoribosylamine--glycine ligase [Bacteroidales bacterium]